jgi:hypothetical protein
MHQRQALILLLEQCARDAQHQPLPLGSALDRLEQSSFALVTLLLCLPFLQPLTLGPLSSAGGLVLASLGWQLMRGRASPWLPEKLRNFALSGHAWERLLGALRWLLKVFGGVTRERLTHWVDGARGAYLSGLLIALGGLLLAIPMPIAPFNNTLPALAMVCAALALLERDGLMYLLSVFFTVLTIIYFTLIFYLLFKFGSEAGHWLKTQFPWLPDWLG